MAASTDVLYTIMTPRGVHDVRISDLMTADPSDTKAETRALGVFREELRAVYDLLPTQETSDVQACLQGILGSSEFQKLQRTTLLLPERLRPFRTDQHSLIQIAIRYHLVRLVEIGTRPCY